MSAVPGRLPGDPSRDELEGICMRNLLASSEERIYFKDREGRFVLVSRNCIERMAPGASADEVLGKTDFDFFDEASAREFFEGEQRIIETGEAQVGILEAEHWRDGSVTWVSTTKLPLLDEAGEIIGTYGISRDVTRQVEAEQALAHQALHDSLTGVANRTLFTDRLEQALRRFERLSGRLAVLFIDLDQFKDVNDFAGHEVGDHVLLEVARRLERVVRPTDTVARLGGDEFVALCADLDDDALISFCQRILQAVEEPISIATSRDSLELTVSASIGIATTEDPRASGNELICDADLAMYRAKQLGGRRLHFVEPGMRERAAARFTLESELHRALERREFYLEYQPLFSLADRRIGAVEALIRWQHPERGPLPAEEFIGVAERRGLIEPIGSWVLDTACEQLARWQRLPGHESLVLAVNLSDLQLRESGVVDLVHGALASHHIDPGRLCLEIAEGIIADESAPVYESLRSLARLGVRIALDDFGTGIASLTRLSRLDIDTLKIDRSFVEKLDGSERSRQIVVAVTAMAHALGMHVVAEGIETDSQLSELNGISCDEGQGYLLARPQSAEAITELLATS